VQEACVFLLAISRENMASAHSVQQTYSG